MDRLNLPWLLRQRSLIDWKIPGSFKIWAASEINHERQTAKELSIKFDLPTNRLQNWTRAKGDGESMSFTNGRPKFVVPELVEELKAKLSGPIAIPSPELIQLFMEAVENTRKNVGRMLQVPNTRQKDNFIIREKDLEKRNVEEITDGRYEATFDI